MHIRFKTWLVSPQSIYNTETLQQQLLLRSMAAGTSDTTVVSTRDVWSSVCNLPRPSGTNKQSAWHKMIVASERDSCRTA